MTTAVMEEAYVNSGSGCLIINARNGEVIDVELAPEEGGDDDGYLTDIVKFDLAERHKRYPNWTKDDHFEILDLGYWRKDRSYEPPEEDWRKDRDADFKEEL